MNRSEHIAEAERLILLSRERSTSTQMQLDLAEASIHAELAKSAEDVSVTEVDPFDGEYATQRELEALLDDYGIETIESHSRFREKLQMHGLRLVKERA